MTPRPPGPSAPPLVGHLPAFARDPLGFLEGLQREHGDVARFRLTRPAVLVSHPDDIERVLLETGKTFHKGYQQGFSMPRVLGNGLVTSEGDFWRRQRKLAQPAFHTGRIGGYADDMVAATRDLLGTWRDGRETDLHRELMLLTQRIVLKTLFDFDNGDDAHDASDALDTVLREMERELGGAEGWLPPFVPTPSRTRLVRALDRLDALVYRIVRDRRERPREHRDLLAMLMDARDDDGRGMTDRQLRDEVMTLYIAGHETTSNTLAWTFLLLSRHPEVREALEREQHDVLGDRPATLADLRALRFTDAVVKESMRLYPAIWSISRVASVDTVLGGYRVERGTEVWLAAWVTQRDERWFHDPLAFRPSRWLEGEKPPKYAYFPFGGGPRVCIGNSFAQMEAVLLLAEISRRFRVHVPPAHHVNIEPGAALRPRGGLPTRLEERRAVALARSNQ